MSQVVSRFLSYVSLDTQSCPGQCQVPSTEKQRALAQVLAKELKEMGAQDVTISEHSYVYASIPASKGLEESAVLGFVAHMDTSPSFSGENVKPRIISGYDGGDLCLNEQQDVWLRTEEFPELAAYRGQDLITTDGTTLLGADDKAGVAEIMTMAGYFLSHQEVPHGPIRIAFTPDEEVGRGTDFFDAQIFGARMAYTVDGGRLGELEYENFNGASGKVTIHGVSIHPGSAKGRMKNALLIAMEFQSLLPAFQNPMYTEGYEGFYHLDQMEGTMEEARMEYIIRDHDRQKFEEKKKLFASAARFLNEKYGPDTVTVQVEDSYYNMKEVIQDHMELIDRAREAMEELDITPIVTPIRGGTDGARLSFMGIPCPNLCTGGHNFHGKYEFICVQSMERIVELLIRIVKKFAV